MGEGGRRRERGEEQGEAGEERAEGEASERTVDGALLGEGDERWGWEWRFFPERRGQKITGVDERTEKNRVI